MKFLKILSVAVFIALMSSLSGCVARVGVPPPLLVNEPPPRAMVEVRPPVPFYGAVWIGGYYEHRHNSYHWVPGRYVKPPHRGARWIPGRWKHHRRGWGWHEGHWR
jgi:hypothetical protein